MQHNQVTALVHVTLEGNLLLLGGIGLGPQPVLDVDAPVDNVGVLADGLCETRAHAGTLVTERRTEVLGLVAVELRFHSLNVLVVLPVDGGVVGETLHLGVSEGVEGELVAGGAHLLVDVGQVGGCIEERSANGEEGDLYVLLADDLEDLLGEVRLAVINGKGEGVGALAGENKVASLILAGDLDGGWDG